MPLAALHGQALPSDTRKEALQQLPSAGRNQRTLHAGEWCAQLSRNSDVAPAFSIDPAAPRMLNPQAVAGAGGEILESRAKLSDNGHRLHPASDDCRFLPSTDRGSP
jgi:hypothetical protein